MLLTFTQHMASLNKSLFKLQWGDFLQRKSMDLITHVLDLLDKVWTGLAMFIRHVSYTKEINCYFQKKKKKMFKKKGAPQIGKNMSFFSFFKMSGQMLLIKPKQASIQVQIIFGVLWRVSTQSHHEQKHSPHWAEGSRGDGGCGTSRVGFSRHLREGVCAWRLL